MPTMIAVDPGDRYIGVAFFEPKDPADPKPEGSDGWECVDAVEFDRGENLEGDGVFDDMLAETVFGNELQILVYERFRLYNDLAVKQTGSEFLTSQLIGAMKFIVRTHNQHVTLHAEVASQGKMLSCELRHRCCEDPNLVHTPVLMVGQRADIMKPTQGLLRKRKIKSVAKPIDRAQYASRGHIVAAELHGWHYLLHGITGKDSVTHEW